MGSTNKLAPTHVQFNGEKGRAYAALKPGATWRDGKDAAGHLAAVTGKPAKPVRRR